MCMDNERTRHNRRQSTFLLGHLLLSEGKRPQHSDGPDEFMLFIISGLRRESEDWSRLVLSLEDRGMMNCWEEKRDCTQTVPEILLGAWCSVMKAGRWKRWSRKFWGPDGIEAPSLSCP